MVKPYETVSCPMLFPRPTVSLVVTSAVASSGGHARCLFHKSFASVLLGAPGSSPAPEATLERGAPREHPGELVVYLRNRHLVVQASNALRMQWRRLGRPTKSLRAVHHTVIHHTRSPSYPCGNLMAGVRGCPRGVPRSQSPSEAGPPCGRLREEQRYRHSLVPREAMPRRRTSFHLLATPSPYWMIWVNF
jgi:hypothetical protein